jgi:hypothetical protein
MKIKAKKIVLPLTVVLILIILVSVILKFSNSDYKFSSEEEITVQNPSYQIDVQNGCGVEDVAFQVVQFLRTKGFDVIDYGNYETTVKESFIIDHIGKPDTARLIAKVLGINEDKIVISKSKHYNEFTVVIGLDYIMLKPFKNKGEGSF